jgi:hypothetical protein
MNDTIARFHPQAWVGDLAIEVDALGETDFPVGDVCTPIYKTIPMRVTSFASMTIRLNG